MHDGVIVTPSPSYDYATATITHRGPSPESRETDTAHGPVAAASLKLTTCRVLLAVATAAYFVTMFMYDGLLMPARMWPSPRPSGRKLPTGFVQRPPSSAAWVLYQNMMRIWSNAFVRATALGGLGALLVTIALAQPRDNRAWIAVVLAVAVLVGSTWLIARAARPKLGVSD